MSRVTEGVVGCEIASSCHHLSERFQQMVVLDGLLQKLFRIPDGASREKCPENIAFVADVLYGIPKYVKPCPGARDPV
jgi:hypothetical protein